jgi:hypothetical protein
LTTGESSEGSHLKKVYVRDSQNPVEPEFTNPEILWLYYNDIDFDQEKLQAILSLPRTSLVSDLIKVLEDSVHRFEYFRTIEGDSEEFDETGSWFPTHAIALLAELKATEAFESLVEVLKQDEDYLEFWFSDMIHDFFWEALYNTGADKMNRLLDIVFDQEISYTAQLVILDCLEQIGHHQPERRNEVADWFRQLLRRIADRETRTASDDNDLGGMIVWCVLDLGYSELLPEIEEIYAFGYASPGTCGTFEDVKSSINEPYSGIGKKSLVNIFERYTELSRALSDYMVDDLDNFEDSYPDEDFDDSDLEDLDFDDDDGIGNSDYYDNYPEPYIAPYKPGRNDPCVCGSGKKYKKCCMLKFEN